MEVLEANQRGGSYETNAQAPGLTTEDVQFYSVVYLGEYPNPHWENKFARPLIETDFSDLPPAFIVAAGIDPLCDDSVAYANGLKAAGVDVSLSIEPELIHGIFAGTSYERSGRKKL